MNSQTMPDDAAARGRARRKWRLGVVTLALLTMAGLTTACAQGVLLPGSAQPMTLPIPLGAQIGTGEVPMSCALPVIGNMTFIASGTGAVGTVLAPGQQFYLTDVHGSLQVPSIFMTLAALIGVTTVNASVTTLNIDTTGATPAVLNAAASPIDVTGIPVTAGQGLVVTAPPTGSLTLGPFTAASSGTATLAIGNVAATITLLNSSGATVGFPFTVTCTAPTPAVVLVGLNINPTAPNNGPSKYLGVTAPAFQVPVGDVEGSLALPLPCTVTGLGQVQLGGTMTAELPAWLPAGKPFVFQSATGSLDLPAGVINALLANYPGATTVSGTIDTLDINAQNSTPAVFNVASPPITVAPSPATFGQQLDIPIPENGTLTVGPWTAGSAGETTLTWGNAGGTLHMLDASGNPVGAPVTVACDPPLGPTILLTEPVTSGAIPAITTIAPASGPTAGATSVTITGTGFTGATAVNFGNGEATYTVNSDTSITATVPAGVAAGPVDVTILGPNGPNPIGPIYTYTG